MKVFFAASFQGKKELGKYYDGIYYELKKLGHHLLDDEVIKYTYQQYLEKMQDNQPAQMKRYKEKIKNIKIADICFFEASYHSLGIGYLIEKALINNKPTIVLYYDKYIPYFLSGSDNEQLIVEKYTARNLKETVNKTLEQAKHRVDKRFNFFISPKLLSYIDSVCKAEGITKSTFIRKLIQDRMLNEKSSV